LTTDSLRVTEWVLDEMMAARKAYLLHNVRRPMNVAFISDQISNRVMAAGLSAESHFTTIFLAILSPILGALADWFGVGTALACLGGGMLALGLLGQVNVDAHRKAERADPGQAEA
jgi:hypothetical protein